MNKNDLINYFSFKDETYKFTQELINNHWLSNEEYSNFWKEKIDKFFIIQEKEILLNPKYITYSLFYKGFKDYILKLQRCLFEIGETSFVITEQKNPLDKSEHLINLKFNVNEDFDNIFIDGEGLNSVFQSYRSIFLIVGESGRWAELIDMEEVDIVISTQKYIDIFKKHFFSV